MSIEPFSREQLADLCPEPRNGGPLDLDDRQLWFLVKREAVTNGWVGKEKWDEIKRPESERVLKELDELLKRHSREHNQ